MEIDLTEIIYEKKSQGVSQDEDFYDEETRKYTIHATHISQCITKTCLYLTCALNNIQIPFSSQSINAMETGKALHLLYQQVIDVELSKLKDDRFGWYPHEDIDSLTEVEFGMPYGEKIIVSGKIDEFKKTSEYYFIEDIKTTKGFKYVDKAKLNHVVQVHVYMMLYNYRFSIARTPS